jgi:SAM-dependent methyltransferase
MPDLWLAQTPLQPLQVYRTTRPDVSAQLKQAHLQPGVTYEYLVPPSFHNEKLIAPSITIAGIGSFTFDGAIQFIDPHYGILLNAGEVFHREHLYSSGPPNVVVSPQLIELSSFATGRVLDFGCGSGALVRHLRSNSVEAWGIEMDNGTIRNSIRPDVAPFITLYDGGFPTHFPDQSFDSIVCSEVLEHIPQFEQAVDEFARLATKKLLVTVPDMSAIPIGFRHRMIPWHLLEGTHVNFFTQTSLNRLLSKHFSRVEFGRMSPCKVNEVSFYVSLVAFCEV